MKATLFRLLVSSVALSAICASVSPLSAADSTATLTTSGGTPAVTSRNGFPVVDLDFAGGSVVQLISTISNSAQTPFSLIGEKAYQDLQLPPITLRSTDVNTLAIALNNLLRSQGAGINFTSPNIFVISKIVLFSSGQPQIPTFQAFQLAPYLATLSIDDITDAVKTAWEADPAHSSKPVTFKYHPATKLLFVYGPVEAITMANVVIPQLNPVASARQRNESFTSMGSRLSVDDPTRNVTRPTAAEEQARLDQVAAEVRRRRGIRDGTVTSEVSPPPAEKK